MIELIESCRENRKQSLQYMDKYDVVNVSEEMLWKQQSILFLAIFLRRGLSERVKKEVQSDTDSIDDDNMHHKSLPNQSTSH